MSDEKKAAKAEQTRPYRLKAGAKFYDNVNRDDDNRPVLVKPGALVQLTTSQAKSFADLFEPA